MEKEFVPYELAVKLKELGFDEPCFGHFGSITEPEELQIFPNTESCLEPEDMINSNLDYGLSCTAPTFSQAFRWFRDKNFHAKIESYHSLGKHKPFGLSIDYLHESGKWTYIDHGGDFDFQTHEEAQERAIEIIIGILEK